MSEVTITYTQRVYCVVKEESGEIERVVADEELHLTNEDGYSVDANGKGVSIPAHSDRWQRAVEVAETVEWPIWDL